MRERRRATMAGSIVVACGLTACGVGRPAGDVRLAGAPVDVATMTAAEVQREVVVVRGDDGHRRYRAPTLRLVRSVDLSGRGGPTTPSRVGVVELARAGFLLGERDPDGTVRHFVVYRSDLVRGEQRYARVTLADGRAVPFRTRTAKPVPCDANCSPVIQSVIAEIPDEALRAAAETGLTVTMTLDNGHSFPVRGPAAYVQGYLAAIRADARPAD